MRITLFTGSRAALSPQLDSAIAKRPATASLWCGATGLEGDEQADPRHHGGPERALHHYPADHYAFWRSWQQSLGLPDPATPWLPGAFGENLSCTGLTEEGVHIGDLFRLGEALVQVSQPRSPCFKLNLRFGYPDFSLMMQLSGRCGWLLRVVEEGAVAPDAELTLIDRTSTLSVKRCADILFNQALVEADLRLLAEHPTLSPNWRHHASQWLERGEAADWRHRLLGPQDLSG
ncbi:MOSC domain-containing protein [Aeromonas schubertii]|uniref:MOSC domain-containing protein n=1 Tax=Aeromonas schubertii TaxID=652 RepID=UPI0038B6361A